MTNSITELRIQYTGGALDEHDANANPFVMFQQWLDLAIAENLPEPNAMLVATAALDAKPSARVLLLRGADERGFVFFTNYASRKGKELKDNPFASLVFFWQPLHRQIRIEGRVERVSAQESDAYFNSRPRGSQLSAAASPQSQVIPNREFLETRVAELDAKNPNHVLRPAQWGGYRVTPDVFEFWQGRENRLHDRLRYTRGVNNVWNIERLAP
ncbi:MAG: pyridoxine/pyridoxamine 5'-phosphate oxidase [Chloroflexota bacterium]|nr:MAG: pyridoxine/pyridoxamine 5'-phosphate oxidase [Chloroflexota bacterium]